MLGLISLHPRSHYACRKDTPPADHSLFRGLRIELSKFKKRASAFFATRDSMPKTPRTRADANAICREEQRRAAIAGENYRGHPMSSSIGAYRNSWGQRLCIWIPRKLSRLLRGARPLPPMNDAERRRCDDFRKAADDAMAKARARHLRKSPARDAHLHASPHCDEVFRAALHTKFDTHYTKHFNEKIDTLRAKNLQGKKSWSMYAVLSEAHDLAFGHAAQEMSLGLPWDYASEILPLKNGIDRKIARRMKRIDRQAFLDPLATRNRAPALPPSRADSGFSLIGPKVSHGDTAARLAQVREALLLREPETRLRKVLGMTPQR